ncbi:MAG: hypothetical protein MUO53_16055 [Maribacter sp.]|nr:hypothetical protein [Maribacter sp.]
MGGILLVFDLSLPYPYYRITRNDRPTYTKVGRYYHIFFFRTGIIFGDPLLGRNALKKRSSYFLEGRAVVIPKAALPHYRILVRPAQYRA